MRKVLHFGNETFIAPCSVCGKDHSGTSYYCDDCKNAYMRDWRKTHPMNAEQRRRDSARSYTHTYVKRGKIVKPDACEWCKSPEKIEAHHPDYSKPLEVIWLCRSCHTLHHRKEAGRAANERNQLQVAA